MKFFKKISFIFFSFLLRRSVGASLLLLSTLAPQILAAPASDHQTANIQTESLKNKKVSYKELRRRKHSKNKSNLKNQTVQSCQPGLVTLKSEVLPSARGITSAVWDPVRNEAYILGGFRGSSLNSIVKYNPGNGSVVTKSETLPAALYGGVGVFNSNNNKIYYLGGAVTNMIVEYDTTASTVTSKTATLPTNRWYNSGIFDPLNNKVYLFGGYSFSPGTDYNDILEYSADTDMLVTKTATLPSNRLGTSAVWDPIRNRAYIFGGGSLTATSYEIDEYDPATDTLVVKSAVLPYSPGQAIFNPLNNKIYLLAESNTILTYDPVADKISVLPEALPSAGTIVSRSALWNSLNNKAYLFGGRIGSNSYSNQIVEYTPSCLPPSNPVISSVTLNGNSISTTSPFRITNGQTFIANFSSTDAYPGNVTTLSCNPPAGIFSSSPAFNSTANLTFTPDVMDVGNTYNYTVTAASNDGASAASSLTFSISVICGNDAGCQSGQACFSGTCRVPCSKDPTIPVGAECTARPAPAPATPSFVQPVVNTPIPTSTPNPTPITNIPTSSATATPTPRPTAATTPPGILTSSPTSTSTPPPIQNITNSGSSTPSSPANPIVPSEIKPTSTPLTQEQIKEIDNFVKGAMFFDIGLIKQNIKNSPSIKPPNVKTDSAPYIDLSKGGKQ